MRALIYDDDDLALECAEALQTRGFETRIRGDCADFTKLLGEFEPDLILLDVHMPEFNGFEALLALAENPRKADIPVTMMSARGTTCSMRAPRFAAPMIFRFSEHCPSPSACRISTGCFPAAALRIEPFQVLQMSTETGRFGTLGLPPV